MKEHMLDLALVLCCGLAIVLTWFIVAVSAHDVHKKNRF